MSIESYEATGYIDAEGFHMDDVKHFKKMSLAFKHGGAVFTLKSARPSRSAAQNRFWHGVVIPLFSEHCGYEFDEMKDALALRLIPKEIVDMSTGEVHVVPGHTSALNTKEFNDLIERAQRLGAEMGIYVPDPGESVTGHAA